MPVINNEENNKQKVNTNSSWKAIKMMSVYYCDSTGVKYFYTLLYNNFTTRLSAIKIPLPSLKDSITLHQKIRDAYRSENKKEY